MTLAMLVPLVVKGSIFLIVFGTGLKAALEDVLHLLRRPGLALRSMLSMNIVMPVVAGALASAFDLHHAVKVALITLGVSPVPPLLPRKEVNAGGRGSYAIALLVMAGLTAIVFVPVQVRLIGSFFGTPAYMPPAAVAKIVLVSVLVPLAAGIIVRRLAPDLAERIARPIGMVATILLVAAALLVIFGAWRSAVSLVGNGILLASAAFVVVGLAVGHLLGGPEPEDRTVLALSTATRHPGVALAIASVNVPSERLVLAAVLLYFVISTILSAVYLAWRRRQRAAGEVRST